MQSLPPPSKSRKWAVWILGVSGVLIVAVIAFMAIAPLPKPPTKKLIHLDSLRKMGVTLALYERVQQGMTYQQVVSILGVEGLKSRSNEAGEVTYMWGGVEMNSRMEATFQNGKLIQKIQSGLK
jgi:hypothetical protein